MTGDARADYRDVDVDRIHRLFCRSLQFARRDAALIARDVRTNEENLPQQRGG